MPASKMENNHQLNVWKYNPHEVQDYPFSPTSYDDYLSRRDNVNPSDGYPSLDHWPYYEFPMQDTNFDAIPFMEYYYPDFHYETFPTQLPTAISIQDYDFCDAKVELSSSVWNEVDGSYSDKPMFSTSNNIGERVKEITKGKRPREESSGSAKMLSRKTISKYFYMPISQASRELNVGLTHLKKRCRELGIQRWPHRKLMSLQTLIKNVQEQGAGAENDEKIRNAVEILEKEMKMVEEMPDLQLDDTTKRLRQACFKANYKKRRLMVMRLMDSQSSAASDNEISVNIN